MVENIKEKKKKSANKDIYKSRKGITLIALIITIIVLLILAGVSISTLTGENGLLTKAQEAKIKNEEAKENDLRQLAMVEAALHLENEEYIDINEKKAVIPAGFAVTGVEGETTIDEGLVITDSKGNEFVWIPVEITEEEKASGKTFAGKYPRTLFANNAPATGLSADYTEQCSNGYEGEKTEYDAMINSVTKNGGFYVGRYETGFNGTQAKTTYTPYLSKPTAAQILEETQKLVVKKGAYVYNYVPWGSAMNDTTAVNKGTADSPQYVIGAVELSKNFAEANGYDTTKVTSTLIYGIQWDMMLRYVADSTHDVTNSVSWGNYNNSTGDANENNGSSNMNFMTGRNEAWQAKNIYDIAGNVWEWTMEAYSTFNRVYRGGSFRSDGSHYPASGRDGDGPYVAYDSISFRLALYV